MSYCHKAAELASGCARAILTESLMEYKNTIGEASNIHNAMGHLQGL